MTLMVKWVYSLLEYIVCRFVSLTGPDGRGCGTSPPPHRHLLAGKIFLKLQQPRPHFPQRMVEN